MILKRASFAFFVMLGILLLYSAYSVGGAETEKTTPTFDLNSLLLKVSLKQGESVTKVLSISKGIGQEISLQVINMPGINLSEKSFDLQEEQTKNVMVSFNSAKLKSGIYVGSIKISDAKNTYYLPIMLEVESRDVFYDVNLDVPPQYSTIAPGEKLVAQLKIFDLVSGGVGEGLGVNNVNLEYSIHSSDGKILSSETESVVVDRQTQLTKTINFPESVDEGDYIFSVVAKYKGSVGIASYLFTISQEKVFASPPLGDSGNWKFYIVLIIVVVFFSGMIVFFVYTIKDRDSLLVELKRYNDRDFKMQRKFILEQEKFMKKRGVPVKVIYREKKHKLTKLKETHKKRASAVEKLKKHGDEAAMKRQLEEWRKKGYNTLGLEYKFKGLSGNEMKSLLGKWKKEYH